MEKILSKENKNKIGSLYKDFKEVSSEVFSDGGEFVKNHKSLLIIGFVAYLIFIRREWSIGNFVKKLEDRIKGDEFGGE